jgi:ankyrin repeat protein
MSANTASSSSSGGAGLDILEAAESGDSGTMKDIMALGDPAVLLATTPEGNTCLHIASMHGHQGFCEEVLAINGSLLTAVNEDGDTPLLTALRSGHAPLASYLLRWCRYLRLREAVLKQDKDGCNALHHAICGNHSKLALELIEAEPGLARAVNKNHESPMFMALLKKDCIQVFDKLVKNPRSYNKGGYGHNALHATVTRRGSNSGEAMRPCMFPILI